MPTNGGCWVVHSPGWDVMEGPFDDPDTAREYRDRYRRLWFVRRVEPPPHPK